MTKTRTFQSKADNQIIIEEQSPVDYRIKMAYLRGVSKTKTSKTWDLRPERCGVFVTGTRNGTVSFK